MSVENSHRTPNSKPGLQRLTGALLTPAQCEELAGCFFEEERFRSRIVMERYAFDRGEYKYFSYPLPNVVECLRQSLYPHLAPIANRWHAAMRIEERFPATHDEFRKACHAADQQRPTPLLLRYQAGDYCCLHQNLYGDHVFPFQAIFLLNEPGRDFEGGELLLTESIPKRPGRADVVHLRQGDAVVLAVNYRPVRSARGFYRASLRHTGSAGCTKGSGTRWASFFTMLLELFNR